MTAFSVKSSTSEATKYHLSYEEYLQIASDSRIMEWVDGEVITYMLPGLIHQDISEFLSQLIGAFVKIFQLGKMIYAPFEVKLAPNGPSREPDILFVHNINLSRLKDSRFEGAPDLVVEIISPSSVREDKVRKFDEYEQAGVPEYWLIDPRPRFETAEFFQLNDEGIYQPADVDENGRYHSHILTNFWINSDWFWQDPLPNPQRCLAEIIISNDAFPSTLRQLYQGLYDYLDN